LADHDLLGLPGVVACLRSQKLKKVSEIMVIFVRKNKALLFNMVFKRYKRVLYFNEG